MLQPRHESFSFLPSLPKGSFYSADLLESLYSISRSYLLVLTKRSLIWKKKIFEIFIGSCYFLFVFVKVSKSKIKLYKNFERVFFLEERSFLWKIFFDIPFLIRTCSFSTHEAFVNSFGKKGKDIRDFYRFFLFFIRIHQSIEEYVIIGRVKSNFRACLLSRREISFL